MTEQISEAIQPQKKVTIENIDPSDLFPRIMMPKMIPEHIARYSFAKQWAEQLTDRGPLTVVDAASGRGYGADHLKTILPSDTKVIGVELGRSYVEKAVEKYNPQNASDTLAFLQGDVRHLPLADNTADLVTAYEITEHLPKDDQQGFLGEISRVLKPDGYGLVSIPYRYSFAEDKQGKVIRIKGVMDNPHHLYEPTKDEMIGMIKDANLDLVASYGQVIVSQKQMDLLQKINPYIPVIAIYAWILAPDSSVQLMDPGEDTVAFTQLFVVKKSPTSIA
jgi:ubiquinone/menaquinone biosynthesis C-methylase UbiE